MDYGWYWYKYHIVLWYSVEYKTFFFCAFELYMNLSLTKYIQITPLPAAEAATTARKAIGAVKLHRRNALRHPNTSL